MSRTFTRLTAAAGTVALATVLAACGSSDPKVGGDSSGAHPEWKSLTFTIGEQSDGIRTLASTSGAFKDASYHIKFAKFDYGPPLIAAASTGDVDLGMVGSVPPIAGASQNLGFKVIATQQPYSVKVAQENIIVPKGSTAKTLADLRGKRIAVPEGSSAHGLLLNALRAAGLKPTDVKIVFLDPKSGAAAFSSGKVDAWSIWNPQSAFAIQQGARVLVAGLPPVDSNAEYYIGSDHDLTNPVRRAALTDVLERIANAYAYGNTHPEAHAEAISTDSGVPIDQVKPTLDAWRYKLEYVTPAKVASGQQLADVFFEAGQITKKVDFASVVVNLLPWNFTAS
ncbi:MAG: transporter, substrate-binding protein aliphatic sulfonates family [Marmoricola sp.]|nr:transporter, substrate-binding protein aliphatic sulfonates family [Marmoricola sp.]